MPEVRPLWETGGLFSDHYLKTRIRNNSWWPKDKDARPLWEFCQQLLNKRSRWLAERGNEQDCRQELIDKVTAKEDAIKSGTFRVDINEAQPPASSKAGQ